MAASSVEASSPSQKWICCSTLVTSSLSLSAISSPLAYHLSLISPTKFSESDVDTLLHSNDIMDCLTNHPLHQYHIPVSGHHPHIIPNIIVTGRVVLVVTDIVHQILPAKIKCAVPLWWTLPFDAFTQLIREKKYCNLRTFAV